MYVLHKAKKKAACAIAELLNNSQVISAPLIYRLALQSELNIEANSMDEF